MKRIKYLFAAACISIGFYANAQIHRTYETNPDRKRTFNWLFGDSIWLDYRTNPPMQKTGSKMYAIESAAVYSDTAGNLILYSDGMNVWDNKHHIIKNGSGLNGSWSSSQGSLFIPQPGNDSIVYLFTTDFQGNSKGFCYNKIKIQGNNDSTVIVEKNIQLLNGSCESISATKHANGIWTWVAVHDRSGTGMNAYLITDKGINKCGVKSDGGYSFVYDIFSCQSKSAFSNDGKLYAISAISVSLVEFLYFDNMSGFFKNKYAVVVTTPTSINFTRDNRHCIVTERDYNILKVNTLKYDFPSIDNHNDSFMISGARFNPYNQLMMSIHDSFFLGKVDNPELPNAKFIRKGLTLQRMTPNELPNFDNSYHNTVGVNFTYKLNCFNNVAYLNGLDTFKATTHHWKVKKVSALSWSDIGNKKTIDYSFNDTGIYQMQYIANNGAISDTITKSILIGTKITKGFLGRDTGYCIGSFPEITLKAPEGMQCFKWNVDSTGKEIKINRPGRYISTVTTNAFCQISDTVNLYEDSIPLKPVIARKGDSLFSYSKAKQYSWYRNNILISRSKDIKINQTGVYKLVLAGNGGCPVESDTFGVYKLSHGDVALEALYVFPNPASDEITISGLRSEQVYHFVITDVMGRIILTEENAYVDHYKIKLNKLNQGIYNLTITNVNNRKSIKLIKQ